MRSKTIFITQFRFNVALTLNSCNINNKNDCAEKSELLAKLGNSFDYIPTANDYQIVKHKFFTLSYAEKYEQAEWVVNELKSESTSYKNFNQPFFITDNLVKTSSAQWLNYEKSGFDKGHLCPVGDVKFFKIAFIDTLYTSNTSPQKHDFNSGIWNTLEQKVRYCSKKYNGIYVVTDPVLTSILKNISKEILPYHNIFTKFY